MSRGKIIFVVIGSALALFIYFMIVDSDISRDMIAGNLPDIVVERVDFARVIRGREWRVKAVDAESESGMINARSLDINVVELATKRETQIYASRGKYSTAMDKMWFQDVDGFACLGDRSVDFTAKRADYDSSSDIWFFSEGVSASDDRIFVTGGIGKIEPDGVLSLGKGVHVRWDIE